ncbi:MAG: glycogen/starch/alpha-glucan phosphorylase [Enterobacteriaceae bacterium]
MEVGIIKRVTARGKKAQIERWKEQILYELRYTLGLNLSEATPNDLLSAVALVLRHHQMDDFLKTSQRHQQQKKKRVYYLSMEFLIGQSLRNNLLNTGVLEYVQEAIKELGSELDILMGREPDAALGNGGLGRLAACFIDSMATLDIAASGHGIKYEYGLFRQQIQDGRQIEQPDDWHSAYSPWLIVHPSQAMMIPIYGRIEELEDADGNYNPMWMDWKIIVGIPHTYLVSGFRNKVVNQLRLYSASASDSFDMRIFNHGDYINAVYQKIESENISKVLYPVDEVPVGKELRLTQEYFLVACTLRDILRDFFANYSDIKQLPERVAIQMNDTHPALTVVELMRILVDEQHMEWDIAWDLTQRTCAFTNHTLMPEALESWPVSLFRRVLPRHLQLIYEINYRFLQQVEQLYPEEPQLAGRVSLIEEGGEKRIRMAYLAIIGSHKVNGVARLHSELIKKHLVPDFYRLMPDKFTNQTNGVTPRRWIHQANPLLANFLTAHLGKEWITDLNHLEALRALAGKESVIAELAQIKQQNKINLSRLIGEQAGINVEPTALFDCQIKRIHEYKRQLLNILHVIYLYQQIVEHGATITPRVCLFAGKAAPGYAIAKLIIQLINAVASRVNHDPRVGEQLKVVFLEDYRVSLAEQIIPATDLSQQISTAGMEASGTSNMKFVMNGALTIGTLDGANIEIRDAVGQENFYLFGMTAEEVAQAQRNHLSPYVFYHADSGLKQAVNSLISNQFTQDESQFMPIYKTLLTWGDRYFNLADFASYCQVQQQIEQDFLDTHRWHQRALLSISAMGYFSSDRTIRGYSQEIWGLEG